MPNVSSSGLRDLLASIPSPDPDLEFDWIPVASGPLPAYSRYPNKNSDHLNTKLRIENDMVLICYHNLTVPNVRYVTVGLFGMAYNHWIKPEEGLWHFIEDLRAPGMRSNFVQDEEGGRMVTHWAPMPDPMVNPAGWQDLSGKEPIGIMPSTQDFPCLVRHVVSTQNYYQGCTTVGSYRRRSSAVAPASPWSGICEFWTHATLIPKVTHWAPLPAPPRA